MPPAYDEEEGVGPLEKGRHRYQKQNYQGALIAFTEAVRISTGHILLTALDHRAATFEKLDQLQSALKDAKEMLELKPELSKGYLRCGKVLQLKGEHELALKIYERGLRKVKVDTDEDRVTLQAMFNKLQKSQAPSKTLDPLAYLPFELAEMIAEGLTIRERMVCLTVSKSWKRVLESSHQLWTTLDTTDIRREISHIALKAYLKRSKYTLYEANIRNGTFAAPKLQYLTRTCKRLQRLTLHGHRTIGESLISALPKAKSLRYLNSRGCEISLRTLLEALRQVQARIEEAKFFNVNCLSSDSACMWPRLENLRTLHVWRFHIIGIRLNNLIESVPNIQTLALRGFYLKSAAPLNLSGLKRLQHLELKDCGLTRLPLLPSTLKRLSLDENLRLSNQEDDTLLLPLLESFSCESTGLTEGLVVSIVKNTPKLKTLFIGNRLLGDYAVAHHDFPSCDSIEELHAGSLQCDEQNLINIVKKCPNLKALDIGYTKITGVAVKQFVDQGIKRLDLRGCNKVSPDAVEFARGKGVDVTFNFAADLGSTFRDRYN
ncbi:fd57b06a-c007-4f58-984c-0eddc6bd36af [Sclerotinia trifoliorum]|uniref:Fd57b06a-c007-4f58-984c-0eddc6bd36af n=1 Tax=Sclerotinia trifoliorum TaxID=28548 RepID=A0A8H2VQP5_9HELO|nr:fd57b06a-c007-4f58-984c-0eddc6bd36af [Sclerotinia trifoliorum]